MFRHLVCASCVVFLLACPGPSGSDGGAGGGTFAGGGTGTGGSGGTGGGTGTLTVDSWCATQSAQTCDFAVRCGFYEAKAGCEATLARNAQLGATCDAAKASVNAGRATFNATAAQTCLSSAMTTCSPSAVCETIFVGTGGLDAGCASTTECGPTFFCEVPPNGCDGHCVNRRGEGESAGNSLQCQAGLYARFGATDGGFGFTCVRQGAAGASCQGYESCLAPLICDPKTNTCGNPLADGADCALVDGGAASYPVCGTGIACQAAFDGGAPTCRGVARRGEPCGLCQGDLRCVVTAGSAVGTCGALGNTGDDCARDQDCVTSLFCKPSGPSPFGPGTCAAPGGVGAECVSVTSCQSGLVCSSQPPSDGGFFPENRCSVSDAGSMGCVP